MIRASILAVCIAMPAAAQEPQCATRAEVLALLAETYGESPRAIGIAGQAAIMEVFASAASGTWSITITLPDGQMCLVASGSNFEAVAAPIPGDET
jgi:hypothetical protein